jgi:hypothetical protein
MAHFQEVSQRLWEQKLSRLTTHVWKIKARSCFISSLHGMNHSENSSERLGLCETFCSVDAIVNRQLSNIVRYISPSFMLLHVVPHFCPTERAFSKNLLTFLISSRTHLPHVDAVWNHGIQRLGHDWHGRQKLCGNSKRSPIWCAGMYLSKQRGAQGCFLLPAFATLSGFHHIYAFPWLNLSFPQ